MSKYAFFYPWRGISGPPGMFLRLSQRMVEEGVHEPLVIDYPDGQMASAVAGTRIGLLAYDERRRLPLPEDAVVVFQVNRPWQTHFKNLEFHPSTRLFFWNLHPFNFIPVMPGIRDAMMSSESFGRFMLKTALRSYRKEMVRFIDFLETCGAMGIMDLANRRTTERYLDIAFKIDADGYLPITVGDPLPRIERPARYWARDGLRLAWVGRMDAMKFHIMHATMRKLDALQPQLGVPVRLTVVGGGSHSPQLEAAAKGLHNISVAFPGFIPFDEVMPFIRENVDVLFGMGASVLDSAQIGVPSILLDVAYAPVPEGYVFRWLSEQEGHTCGNVLGPQHIVPGNTSLHDRLRDVMADFDAVSRATWDYYARAHALSMVYERFIARTQDSRCDFRRYEGAGFMRRDLIYDAFAALRGRVSASRHRG